MKIGILSDLHIDLTDREQWRIIPALAQVCKEEGVSHLLLAGDLANDYAKTLEYLHAIESLAQVKCLFVPGNHDIWNLRYHGWNSWQTYQALQNFSGNLANGPIHLNHEWVVIGDLGWYDYTFGSTRFTVKDFDAMEYSEMLWQDGLFANWGQPSLTTSQFFYEKIRKQLESVAGKKIILMTHIVPHADFTVHSSREMWQYFNAFLGSRAYGELAINTGVQYYIFGHVHYRLRRQINGVDFICNSLGYTREWRNPLDPRAEVRQAFLSIEI